MVRSVLALLLLSSACAAEAPEAPVAEASQDWVYDRPHTFWGAEELRPAIECAVERLRAATCLDLAVVEDAHHTVLLASAEDMGGLTGRTNGVWTDTRIRVRADATVAGQCGILVHEIGEHVLRRSNDHAVSASNSLLTEDLVAGICEVRRCGCFNPEG